MTLLCPAAGLTWGRRDRNTINRAPPRSTYLKGQFVLRRASIVLVSLLVAFQISGALAVTPPARSTGAHHAPTPHHPRVLRDRVLLANGGFEDRSLRPWQARGSAPPRLVTAPRHGGTYAALVGRTRLGPAATSALALRVAVPPAAGLRLVLYAWQQFTADHPRSMLTVAVDAGAGRVYTLLRGCGLSTSWTRLALNLSSPLGHTIAITAAAHVAADEVAALVLDDVNVTAVLPYTPTSTPITTTPTPTATATGALSTTLAATITAPVSATASVTTTAPVTAPASVTPTATPTDVPDICLPPAVAVAYQRLLPTMSPTPTPRPAVPPAATPTGTVSPTATAVWWRSPTATPSSTPTSGPTPGYSATPGPAPTMGTTCHPVAKGISYGFVSGGTVASAASPIAGAADAGAVAATGAHLVRIDLHLVHDDSWTAAEYAPYDRAVNAFRQAGVDVMGLVGPGIVSTTYDPNAWIANSMERSGGNGDNSFLHAFASAVLALVGHFHGRINTWELWNEPNVGQAGMTGTYMYPSNFAAMLADTYALVKASYPDVTLVSGGILSDDDAGHSTPDNTGATYLRQTYYMGLQVTHTWDGVRAQFGGNPLDAIGQHLYLDQGGLAYTRHIVAAYQWMHDAYGAFGDGAKPLYMTEGAWSTDAVSPQQQALDLDVLYALSANPAVPYVKRVYWYLLRDGGAGRDQTYGLETLDGSPKPAFYRFLAH